MSLDSSRGPTPQLASPGQPISAAFINLIVRAVRKALRITGGNGIRVSQSGDQIVVELERRYQVEWLYRVSAIRVNGSVSTSTKGATVTAVQNTISYDIEPYADVTRSGRTDVDPDFRIEDDTLQIRSAPVGAPVRVWNFVTGEVGDRDTYVYVYGERLDTGTDCPESP